MKFKAIAFILIISLTVFSVCGCKTEKTVKNEDYPVTVAGTSLSAAPRTVACLSEASASAVSALGHSSYLTGAVSEYIKSTGSTVKDLGPTYMPSWEDIYALSPDVLITSAQLSDEVKEKLALKDITVIMLKTPTAYSEVAAYYENISKIFLGAKKYKEPADTFNSENDRHLEAMKKTNQNNAKKVAVYLEAGFVATGDTLAGELLNKVGINNVAQHKTNEMMSAEELSKANPDVIFCPIGCSQWVLGNERLKGISAVKNGAVYEINASALAFAGEGMVSTLQDMTNYLKRS